MRRLADGYVGGTFSNTLRSRRFQAFDDLVARVAASKPGPVRILDLGGTNAFWEQRGWAGRPDVQIVTVNLLEEEQRHENLEPRVGDVTALAVDDASFDIVFSNSVIEHLMTFEQQEKMAREVRRAGAVYWVQTPNFWFPVEPHFLTVGWHWLPRRVRIRLLQRRGFGWCARCPDPTVAARYVDEVRLMRRNELSRLFPDARIVRERIGPLTKSFIAIRA
jgi:hypothetical protein